MKLDFLIHKARGKHSSSKVVSFYITFKIPDSLKKIVENTPKLSNSLGYAFRYTEENTWEIYPIKVFVKKKEIRDPNVDRYNLRLYIPYLRENTKLPVHLFLDEFLWPDFYTDEEVYRSFIEAFSEEGSHKPFYTHLDDALLMKILLKFKERLSFVMIHPSDQMTREYYMMTCTTSIFSNEITLLDIKGNKAFNCTLYAYDFVNLLNDHIISIRERNSKV